MSTERNLLAAALADRSAFDLIEKHCPRDDLTEPGKVVFDHIVAYYDRDPEAMHVDVPVLTELVLQSVSNPKHKDTFATIMDGLSAADVSAVNVAETIVGARRDALGQRLAAALASGQHGDAVGDLMDEYRTLSVESLTKKETSLVVGMRLSTIADRTQGGALIPMAPRSLNLRLGGGMLRGHHVIVFARPEMGKTLFLVNLMSGWLRSGMRVLYLGNEDPIEDVALRMVCRITGQTASEVLSDADRAQAVADERGYTNWIAAHMEPGSPREVEEHVRNVRPDVVVIDQIRNISMKEDNFVRQLEKAATAMRQMGGRYDCLVVSTTQAGDSASGKSILDMGDVDSSNTGIPAQADVMIGIGASRDDEAAGRRVLSLCKNKRTGRHDFFPVRVDTMRSKLSSMD